MITQQYIDALKVIDRAHVRMWYQVELTPTDAVTLLKGVGDHCLAEMIEKVNAALPVCDYGMLNGAPNQNNGTQNHRIAIGRENSRVVYVRFIKTFHEKMGDEEWARIRRSLDEIGQEFGCSENNLVIETGEIIEWRYWWD